MKATIQKSVSIPGAFRTGSVLIAFFLTIIATGTAAAAPEDRIRTVTSSGGVEMAAGEVVVKLDPDASGAQRSEAIRSIGATEVDPVGDIAGARVVELGESVTIGTAIRRLNEQPGVEYAHPNFIVRVTATPNDPFFNQQWGHRDTVAPDMDINAEQAWEYTTGSPNVDIAVVDTGVAGKADYGAPLPQDAHPDLDGNVDFQLSRNFHSGPGADPTDWTDDFNHGTPSAGTIGAEGNNGIGISGINWDTNLIAIKALSAFGAGTVSDVAAALDYAGDVDAEVVNVSIAFMSEEHEGQPVSLVRDAVAQHPDSLYVFAAANQGRDLDIEPTFPCGYELANSICVAATEKDGNLWGGSNYSDQLVHLGAPSAGTYSTNAGVPAGYGPASGTSIAAPHVSGVAGLVYSMEPSATTQEVKSAILENVTPTASLVGKTVTEGRLNAADAVQSMTRFSECKVPGGSTYRTFWEAGPNSTIDITDIRGKAPSEAFFRDYVDTWGDVSKLEWYSLSTIASIVSPSGSWGDPDYPGATNAWDYAASWGAEDQRTDILATNPYPLGSPRVSFRTNGSGLARDSDTCNTYLSKWPAGTGKRTVVAGDSMVSQMTKKFVNQSGWKPFVEPQSKSSFANMKGEIRGLASGLVDSTTDEQTKPEVMVMALGTKDADAIAALATQPER
ncbi:MAG TPA: S8 family serine peptidase, partial [Solirubrobacterales bacterium]|nr:S8 family serine peptidase [Solirubrobacterales bacterium]